MQTKTLYRYVRSDGGIDVSPNKPETEYTTITRLIADDGYFLRNGETECECIDTETPEEWEEIPNNEIEQALNILLGVNA